MVKKHLDKIHVIIVIKNQLKKVYHFQDMKGNQMEIKSIKGKVLRIKEELEDLAFQIRQLPENPDLEPIGNSGGAFTISISSVHKHSNLSPTFHIFKCQYEAIAQIIETYPIDKVLEKLDTIMQKGKIYQNNQLTTFHPQVIENLKGLIE